MSGSDLMRIWCWLPLVDASWTACKGALHASILVQCVCICVCVCVTDSSAHHAMCVCVCLKDNFISSSCNVFTCPVLANNVNSACKAFLAA